MLCSEVAEHIAPRLIIHFGFPGELILQRHCLLCRRACPDLIRKALEVRQIAPCLRAQHYRHHPRLTPNAHIRDGVGTADHISPVGQMIIQNPVMTLGFIDIALFA